MSDRFESLEFGDAPLRRPVAEPPPAAPPAPFAPPRAEEGEAPGWRVAETIGGPGTRAGEFASPAGLAVDALGNLYVADAYNHRIQRIIPEGDVSPLGERGNGRSQFLNPQGIAVDSMGRFYVAEQGNARVQVFDADGDLLAQIGRRGDDPGSFLAPRSIALAPEGSLYVADAGHRRVTRWATDGRLLNVLAQHTETQPYFGSPRAVAVDRRGYLYVADATAAQVLVFTPGLRPAARIATAGEGERLRQPHGVAVHPEGFVLVADAGRHSLEVYELSGRHLLSLWGVEGAGPFREPTGVAVAPDGSIYLSDTGNHRVVRIERRAVERPTRFLLGEAPSEALASSGPAQGGGPLPVGGDGSVRTSPGMDAASLLWQQRHRGVLPLVANSVADDGGTLVLRADEVEVRTYQLLRVATDGRARELCALTVETVRKFEVSPDGSVGIGMTLDDLYLFREGRKSRFMPDRRVTYHDAAVSREGAVLGCAFSEQLLNSHSAALGEAAGRVAWTKETDAAVNRVALAADGRALALGGAGGQVVLLDHTRTVRWATGVEAPVTALALRSGEGPCAAGTESGSVLLLDERGAVRWRVELGAPVLDVALDDAGEWVAAAAGDTAGGRVVAFAAEGAAVWEVGLSAQPTGVSLSPNGRYFGVSLADGNVLLFEADFRCGRERTGTPERLLEDAAALAAAGDYAAAHAQLSKVLAESPGLVAGAEQLVAVEEQLVEHQLAEAGRIAEAGEPLQALRLLDAAQAQLPYEERLFARRGELRRAACGKLAEAARLAGMDLDGAAALLRELLALDPRDLDARRELAELGQRSAQGLVEEGDRLAAMGEADAAIAQWQRARELAPRPDLDERLRRAELERGMAAGRVHYDQQRFAEAAFQFRKVLALDPDHDEARKYLGYTQSAGPDSVIRGRFGHLE